MNVHNAVRIGRVYRRERRRYTDLMLPSFHVYLVLLLLTEMCYLLNV